MKKHLIAAAVAAAVAVPAMAQVTVYGIAEVGVVSAKSSAGVSTSTLTSAEFNSNRLGFKGEEDLGGGMKAFFRLESGTDTSNGTAGGKDSFFSRGAEVGLSGGFGRVSLGKLDHNGIEGNEISLVANRGLFGSTSGTAVTEASGRASDLNDTMSYTTPSFNGISANIQFTPNDNGASTIAGTTSTSHAGVHSYQVAGSVSGVSFKLGGGTLKELDGTKINVRGGSVSYNFGPVKAAIAIQSQDNPGTTNDASESIISATIPLGGGLTVGGAYGSLDVENGSTSDFKATMLMLKKDLSKRTSVIGMYRTRDSGAANTSSARTTGVFLSHSF